LYGPSRLDAELEPDEDALEREELRLESEELSELASDVELLKQPSPPASARQSRARRSMRNIEDLRGRGARSRIGYPIRPGTHSGEAGRTGA
jgi:hypothetical protein